MHTVEKLRGKVNVYNISTISTIYFVSHKDRWLYTKIDANLRKCAKQMILAGINQSNFDVNVQFSVLN